MCQYNLRGYSAQAYHVEHVVRTALPAVHSEYLSRIVGSKDHCLNMDAAYRREQFRNQQFPAFRGSNGHTRVTHKSWGQRFCGSLCGVLCVWGVLGP